MFIDLIMLRPWFGYATQELVAVSGVPREEVTFANMDSPTCLLRRIKTLSKYKMKKSNINVTLRQLHVLLTGL